LKTFIADGLDVGLEATMKKSRRSLLQSIGATGIASTVPIVSASEDKYPKVVTKIRPYNNPISVKEIEQVQKQAAKNSDHDGTANIGKVNSPDGCKIVGITYGIKSDGTTSRWIAGVPNDGQELVKEAHQDVKNHKKRLKKGEFK